MDAAAEESGRRTSRRNMPMREDNSHNFHEERAALLRELRGEVRDEAVLDAIAAVPRERFVAPDELSNAYANIALPVGQGQTISQPTIVAVMTEALGLTREDGVLEVGTGSGYQAAVLARLAREVITVERVPSLATQARDRLSALGCANVRVNLARADVLGWPEEGPYDCILVAAGAPTIPEELLAQLAKGGRMVIPVGEPGSQRLVAVHNTADGIEQRDLGGCAFVPLIGRQAWSNEDG